MLQTLERTTHASDLGSRKQKMPTPLPPRPLTILPGRGGDMYLLFSIFSRDMSLRSRPMFLANCVIYWTSIANIDEYQDNFTMKY